MSNKVIIQATKFVNYPDKSETYGYRVYDDYGKLYNNCMEKSDIELDSLGFFAKILFNDISEEFGDILSAVIELEKGITINGEYYEYEELKDLFEEVGLI